MHVSLLPDDAMTSVMKNKEYGMAFRVDPVGGTGRHLTDIGFSGHGENSAHKSNTAKRHKGWAQRTTQLTAGYANPMPHDADMAQAGAVHCTSHAIFHNNKIMRV